MNDIIQTSAVAKRGKAENTTITKMAAAVRELPEYQQTMNKLGQHVDIAQRCMTVFTKDGLLNIRCAVGPPGNAPFPLYLLTSRHTNPHMNISGVEQMISTGEDEEGKEIKGAKLIALLMEGLRSPAIDKAMKLRLLAIFIAAQREATSENKKQLIQAAKLSGSDQQLLTNLERLSSNAGRAGAASSRAAAAAAAAASSGGVFSSLFTKTAVKHEKTPEGEYTDTRHVGQLKVYLSQLVNGDLPGDKFPSLGPAMTTTAAESKSNTAKSVRKQHASRWGKKDAAGGAAGGGGPRYMVFVAGGLAYSELRAANEVSVQNAREVVIGGSHLITPTDFLIEVADLE